MSWVRLRQAIGAGAVLALAGLGACGREDSPGGDDDGGSIFGDTGGLISVDPTGGGSGSESGGASGTGATSTGDGTGSGSTSGGGGGTSTGGGTTTSGTGGTGASVGSGSSSGGGGGATGGTSSGGGSSSGGSGGCPIDVTCGGELPYCDTNRSPPACVASAADTVGEFCFSDADCNFGEGGTGVVCDLIFTCAQGCWSDADCTWDRPFCDTNSLAPSCVASPTETLGDFCFQDGDCNFGLPQSEVVCSFFTCVVGCHADNDCIPNQCCDPFWEPGSCTPC